MTDETPADIRCHDCGNHDKCEAQQHAEDAATALWMELQASRDAETYWTRAARTAEAEITRLRNLIGNECE